MAYSVVRTYFPRLEQIYADSAACESQAVRLCGRNTAETLEESGRHRPFVVEVDDASKRTSEAAWQMRRES
jgi:hypothetical protein